MKNWRSTLVGVIGAAAAVVQPLVMTGQVDKNTLVLAATVAALGFLAKDAGQTGTAK